MDNIEKLKDELKNNLSKFRYEHSLLVATEAYSLAQHYNLDTNKAYVAGLIHDIAKEYTDEENEYYCENYLVDSKFLNPEYKHVLHAEIGALVAHHEYGMDDEICQAIRYHALGNVEMTFFDKIIFVADKIGRKQQTPLLEMMKRLAYENIDEAIIYYLQEKRKKIAKRGQCFLIESLILLDYLSKKR